MAKYEIAFKVRHYPLLSKVIKSAAAAEDGEPDPELMLALLDQCVPGASEMDLMEIKPLAESLRDSIKSYMEAQEQIPN
jgi:hypothetical protein